MKFASGFLYGFGGFFGVLTGTLITILVLEVLGIELKITKTHQIKV